jgi:hypothetical protein
MDHYWLDLPGPVWFSGADIYRDFVESVTGPVIAVELGAWKGRSTSCMGVEIANSGKPIRFFTIDHWLGSEGEDAHDEDDDLGSGRLFEVFKQNIGPVADYVTVIRDDSRAAASRFDDASVDFLYVDASHSYDGVLGDLIAWYPKVKVGGVIAGDDWCFTNEGSRGVRRAVLDFFGAAATRLAILPGSAPNEDWLQWSITKTADLPIASPAAIARARVRTKLARAVVCSTFLYRLRSVAPGWLRSYVRDRA